MKQRLFIFSILIGMALVLAGLNAVSYVQKPKMPDSEHAPNRSTYNPGATGAQAFFALLSETGRRVIRWQSPIETLPTERRDRPATFVIIGKLRREVTSDEAAALLKWVAAGGRLVLIDREPMKDLLVSTANWQISVTPKNDPALWSIEPSDRNQMIASTHAERPLQPTGFTRSVNAVQPSRFGSAIYFERFQDLTGPTLQRLSGPVQSGPPPISRLQFPAPPPPPAATPSGDQSLEDEEDEYVPVVRGPVVHVGSQERNLLVDVPFGSGQIVVLADPFIVSNAGIDMADNVQLAINIVDAGGLIAFDEYHHGYGSNNNRFFQYFEGTPVVPILLHCVALVALLMISQSRRFGRPVPEAEPNRLSKLEYIAAMAELQRRTSAYDLAIENIYADFRRRTTRLFGIDNRTTHYGTLAQLIAERSKTDLHEIESVLSTCENIMHGEPTSRRQMVRLTRHLREIEDSLGLQRSRERA